MSNKPAYSIADQISLLKQRGMLFRDEGNAPHFLENISYYRLKGYWWDTQNGGAAESDTVRLGAGESKSYLLEWQWPYESGKDGIDTNAGKADLDYRVRLKIWAQQEGP